MMLLRVFALVLVALVCVGRADEECQEEKEMFKKEINAMLDSGDFECAAKHDLARFKYTSGEDIEEDKKKEEEFNEFMGEMDDETKKEVLDCMGEIMGATTEKISGDMGEECMNIILDKMG